MSEWFRWWLVVQLAGFVMLPLCVALFRRLPDRGYTLSKPFGLLFLGYIFWLLNSLHIVPNSPGGIIFALLLLAALSGAFLYVRREEMRAWVRGNWQYIVGVEVVLLLVFAFAAWMRSIVGTTTLTEQPMDLMFVNSATRASHFPPQDPWLSGHTVAYYYFGYLLVAMTGKLAGVPPEIAYNLGFAMTATLALVGASGIAYNLVRMHETASADDDADADGERAAPAQRPPRDSAPREPRPKLTSLLIQQRTRRMAPAEADDAPPPVRAPAPAQAPIAAAATAELPATAAPSGSVSAASGASAQSATIVAGAAPDTGLSWRGPLFGLLAGLMLVALGNFVWVFEFASAYGIGGNGFYHWLGVNGLTAHLHKNSWYPSDYFAFFGASRIYALNSGDWVITEFPMFSFILGDLHPHVMALPFVLLAVGLALALYRSREPLDIVFWIQRPLALVAAAIALGGLAFLNTWDIATLAFVLVAAAALSNFLRVRHLSWDLALQVVSFAVPLLVLAIVLYLPFYLSFSSQADGIGAVVSNRSVTVPGTRPSSAALYWGPLFVVTLPLVFSRLAASRRRITPALIAASLAPAALILAGWVLMFSYEKATGSSKLNGAAGLASQISDRGSAWLTDAVFAALLASALLALWLELTSEDRAEERHAVIFTLGLIATAMLLVCGTEFFYVGDVFNSRMNTVFKLYYQAWLLLAVAGGFCLYYLFRHWRWSALRLGEFSLPLPRASGWRWAWAGAAVLVLAAGALYPIGATMDRLRPYDTQGNLLEHGGNLDALSFMSPDERAGVSFLTNVAQGQDVVIAEAVGGDYWVNGQFARISMATGVPAVLGWGGHEDQWHGSSAIRAGRFEDVNKLYQTNNMDDVNTIVKKYGIDYIYVGPLERTTYGDAALAKFQSMPVVFQQGTVTIYRASAGSTTGEVQNTR